MNDVNLKAVVSELERIARAAGVIMMRGYRSGASITKKGSIDLVTEYDLAVEALVTEELKRSFADIAVIAEEGQGKRAIERHDAALRFFVDPIDGTTNFAHGHPFFAVSLGLCRGPAPLAGVVFAPALGVCWTGSVGHGATRNGEACFVSERALLGDALCATGFGYDVVDAGDEDNVAEFRYVQQRARAVRRCGAAALDLTLVADGTYDAYWEAMLQPWDMAGGAAIVLAAGGRTTGFAGEAIDVQSGAVIASNGRVHDALVQAIAEARHGRPVRLRG
ncbi:MAG: Inositol-monophosphatase [Myxococcaceae bacterium]|nr:Inositol-monophosphatase [Myxococcaceae bacterium]